MCPCLPLQGSHLCQPPHSSHQFTWKTPLANSTDNLLTPVKPTSRRLHLTKLVSSTLNPEPFWHLWNTVHSWCLWHSCLLVSLPCPLFIHPLAPNILAYPVLTKTLNCWTQAVLPHLEFYIGTVSTELNTSQVKENPSSQLLVKNGRSRNPGPTFTR